MLNAGLLEQLRGTPLPVDNSDQAAAQLSRRLVQNTHHSGVETSPHATPNHNSTVIDNSERLVHPYPGPNGEQRHTTEPDTDQQPIPTISLRFPSSFLGPDICNTTTGTTPPVVATAPLSTADGRLTYVPSESYHACPGDTDSLPTGDPEQDNQEEPVCNFHAQITVYVNVTNSAVEMRFTVGLGDL